LVESIQDALKDSTVKIDDSMHTLAENAIKAINAYSDCEVLADRNNLREAAVSAVRAFLVQYQRAVLKAEEQKTRKKSATKKKV
jgi:hypothetical protein